MNKINEMSIWVRGGVTTFEIREKLYKLAAKHPDLQDFKNDPDRPGNSFYILPKGVSRLSYNSFGFCHDESWIAPMVQTVSLDQMFKLLDNRKPVFKAKPAKSLAIHAEIRAVFI